MSTVIKKEISCPHCGETDVITIVSGINCRENPEYKFKILNETLFDWTCKHCGYYAQMSYPMVYHDPKEGYMIALYRTNTKGNKVEAGASISHLVKRRVKNLAELKEKILIFDAGLDDVAVELNKNALCSIIRKSYGTNKIQAYFSQIQQDGSVEFAIFIGDRKEPLYHATKKEVYDQSAEVLRSLNYSEPNEFLRVGPSLAEKLLEKYKSL